MFNTVDDGVDAVEADADIPQEIKAQMRDMRPPKAQGSEQEVKQGLEIWPEHVPVVHTWLAMQTQWRVSMAGLVGLDYTALPVVFAQIGIAPDEQPKVFSSVQVVERFFLRAINQRQAMQ